MAISEAPLGDKNNAAWSRGAQEYFELVYGQADGKPGFMQPLIDMFDSRVGSQLQLLASDAKRDILDVASGPGEPGLSLAAQHKDSTVTVTDYSQGMVEVARQRGEKMGLRNTRYQQASGDDLSAFADGSFAVVTCNCAIFVMDWRKALAEWARVLQPGGFVTFTTWDSAERHQFSLLMGGTIRSMVEQGLSKPPPFKMEKSDDPEPILAELRSLGFEDAESRDFSMPTTSMDPELFRRSLLDQPMMAEWIDQSCGSDRAGFYQKAYEALQQTAAAQGRRQPDGTYTFTQNDGKFFTGRKKA